MKMLRLFISIFPRVILLFPCLTWAQESQKPVPQPPYVAPVPNYSRWIVTLKAPEATPSGTAPKDIPEKIEIVKTGGSRRTTVSFKNGVSNQYHEVKGYLIANTPAGVNIYGADPEAVPYEYYTKGYLFVEGVGPDSFRGVTRLDGVECFYYQTGTMEAWIAVDSMLPIASRQGGVIARFQFLPPPDAAIELPSEQSAVLQKLEKAQQAFRAMR